MENNTIKNYFNPEEHGKFFSWYDYLLFGTMLTISGSIGIYFGFFGKKQTTAKDYLLGGKNLKVIPVVISLIASHTSGITLLGVPADVYVFGASYWLGAIAILVMMLVTIYVFLPVFYNLHLTSTYEYLGKRFDDKTRKVSSFLFALSVFVHLPIVIYIPSLAFSAATGIDVHIITPVVCSICIFYTTIGGMKALVWADTVQFSLTFAAISIILGLGIEATGGVEVIWRKILEQGRLDIFDFDIDMTKRESFWALIIGLSIHWCAHTSVNQGCTQKFLSVNTIEKSKRVVVLYCVGMTIVKSISVCNGLILAARYSDCDPFITNQVTRNDQILPYYVLDVARHIPGLAGLFIAGVFSASLSAFSSNLNSLAGTIYEDFLKGLLVRKGFKNAGNSMKVLVIIIGATATLMVYVVERLGGILAISIGLGSIAHGPLLGMFVMGALFPRANKKGAFHGTIVSIICMSVIVFGCNAYKSLNLLKFPHKPISVDNCNFYVNKTILQPKIDELMIGSGEDIFPVFRISFYWYTMLGAIIGSVSGLIISFMTEPNKPPVPKKYLSPIIYRFLSKDRIEIDPDQYYLVDEARLRLDIGTEADEKLKEKLRKASYCSEIIDEN